MKNYHNNFLSYYIRWMWLSHISFEFFLCEFWLRYSFKNYHHLDSVYFWTYISCCCCLYWPPVREVCPNYVVVEFQPRTINTTDLGSVAYCYVHLLNPPHPPFLPTDVPSSPTYSYILPPHVIIHPPRRHPSPSQNTNKTPSPSLPSPVATRALLFLSSLDFTTSSRFPLLSLPLCWRNLF